MHQIEIKVPPETWRKLIDFLLSTTVSEEKRNKSTHEYTKTEIFCWCGCCTKAAAKENNNG